MQNELPNREILRWVSAGAKNYAYEHVEKGDVDGASKILVRRIRGFELNYRAGKKLTFERMLSEVESKFGLYHKRYYFPNFYKKLKIFKLKTMQNWLHRLPPQEKGRSLHSGNEEKLQSCLSKRPCIGEFYNQAIWMD